MIRAAAELGHKWFNMQLSGVVERDQVQYRTAREIDDSARPGGSYCGYYCSPEQPPKIIKCLNIIAERPLPP